MKELVNLQNQFIDGVYDGGKKHILPAIKNGKAPKKELLGIYQNNMSGGLINALRITYPKVFNFLKEKKFNKIALEFIASNRSQSGNLDDYGESFHEVLFAKKEYFLSDLAKAEWLKQKAYLAADVAKIDLKKLQSLPEEKLFSLKFKTHPSSYLLVSSYNILALRKQNKASKNHNYFLIYRHDLELKTQKILKSEYDFLKGIKDNLTLYQIYQKHRLDIGSCLSKYIANAVITSFASK